MAKNKKIKIGLICLGSILILLVFGIVFKDQLEYYWSRSIDPLLWELRYTLSGCDKLEKKIHQQIEQLNYCQIDEDCTIEFFDCPFGCGSYLNKNANIASVKEQVNSYHNQCGRCEYGCMRPLNPVCQNQKCAETQALCESDKIYVDLSQCRCPEGTEKFIETPEGGEEAVLICKTKISCSDELKYNQPTFWQAFYSYSPACQGCFFYEEQALAYIYEIRPNYVLVSGCISNAPGAPCQEKTIELAVAREFYLPSGKEQSVSVRLEKIENQKAYFVFRYGAAPPACETVGGCDYACQFTKPVQE